VHLLRGADKSLAWPRRKQARKYVRKAHDFNDYDTPTVIKFFFFFLQGKAPKAINAILTEKLCCFLPGRVKDLSAASLSNTCNVLKRIFQYFESKI